MHSPSSSGCEPNPHVLAALARAAQVIAIVPSQDIIDSTGTTLWSRGQLLAGSFQQRLQGRRLRQPIERCLRTEGDRPALTLRADLEALLDAPHALAPAWRPWAHRLMEQIGALRLQPLDILLLATQAATCPAAHRHAVAGMAVAGAMVASQKADSEGIRQAMIAGLLHDLGKLYAEPRHRDDDAAPHLGAYRRLAAHPRVAQQLLSRLSDHPPAVARAIGEHHERLDGSGYPAHCQAGDISTLGRVLAVMEAALGSMDTGLPSLQRIAFGLRVVPGEFDPTCAAFFHNAARQAGEEGAAVCDRDARPLAMQLASIDQHISEARHLQRALREQRRTDPITGVVGAALDRLARLRNAWSVLQLRSATLSRSADDDVGFDHVLGDRELRHRLHAYHRECLLRSDGLTEAEKYRLAPLWRGLLVGDAQAA